MAFKLGDIIIDRLQFGYGASSSGTPLYALTQLTEASIEISADSEDITDKDGNLVYRKYKGKKGEVTATNAFMNLAVIEALSATDAEIADNGSTVKMPVIQEVKAGKNATLDITGCEKDSDGTYIIAVSGLSKQGSLGKEYLKAASGEAATETEYYVKNDGTKDILYLPTNNEEIKYIVKYNKEVKSGAKSTNTGDNFPKSHELFFKALAVDPCDKENFRAVIIHIPSFMPSPEFTLALQGGDSQTMEYKGAMMLDTCSADKELFSVYFVDEVE